MKKHAAAVIALTFVTPSCKDDTVENNSVMDSAIEHMIDYNRDRRLDSQILSDAVVTDAGMIDAVALNLDAELDGMEMQIYDFSTVDLLVED